MPITIVWLWTALWAGVTATRGNHEVKSGASILLLIITSVLMIRATEDRPLRIAITHTLDGSPLILDSLRYQLASGERFSVSRLSFLISEIAFETESGQWVEAKEVGFFDLGKRLLIFNCQLPAEAFRAMRFSIGLPPDINHSDPAKRPAKHPLNPDFNRLHWTWADGYIFMALEGRYYDQDDSLSGYVFHYANDENKVQVSLPLQLSDSANALIELNFDVGIVFNFPAPISFLEDGNSTHSHPDDGTAAKLKKNIPSAFQLQRITELVEEESVVAPKPIDMPDAFTPYAFKMSRNFPMPDLPADNPLIEERVELGKALFFDTRLSSNYQVACASCHQPGHAFSDSRTKSRGVGVNPTRRHSMPLFNLAWKNEFFWDGRVKSLREQVFHPIEHPDELGISVDRLIERLRDSNQYKTLFAKAFSPETISREHIGLALENFLLSLVSYRSRFDDAAAGKAILTEDEKRGFELFMTEYEPRSRRFGADCFHCHGGALFTDNQFHNNGLSPSADKGRQEYTGIGSDDYKFSTPSLRNVALTAPYMHDGSLDTLDAVVRHYSSGIHLSDTLDPNLAKHPRVGIQLSESDQRALIAFLKTLSDPAFSNN